jgi:hypothetical protein
LQEFISARQAGTLVLVDRSAYRPHSLHFSLYFKISCVGHALQQLKKNEVGLQVQERCTQAVLQCVLVIGVKKAVVEVLRGFVLAVNETSCFEEEQINASYTD